MSKATGRSLKIMTVLSILLILMLLLQASKDWSEVYSNLPILLLLLIPIGGYLFLKNRV